MKRARRRERAERWCLMRLAGAVERWIRIGCEGNKYEAIYTQLACPSQTRIPRSLRQYVDGARRYAEYESPQP